MADRQDQRLFDLRWQRSERDLLSSLGRIYGDVPGLTERLKTLLAARWQERPRALKDLDIARDIEPDWFLSQRNVGYVFYIDRFSQSLRKVLEHIDYIEEMGATYVHFMPCLKPRPAPNDGGYSVMDYRAINPDLGTMDDLEAVAAAMRARGVSICIDLVLNHTAKEHEWAQKAKAGDPKYQAYYWMFDTDAEPKAYEKTLVEIFPADAPGNFTYYPDFRKWVWTTFNEHQWDLNWSNPDVFLEIVDVMLSLANRGVEVLRLDAVAFMWKRLGSNCQNQPEVHDLLQALRAATRIAAPALIHKAEAIVAPRDLVPYLGQGRHTGREANLAYHNNLMVQYWSSLASRDTTLMTHVLGTHFPETFRHACWATYIRCHDDIGWAITEEDGAAIPGVSGAGHRNFLADFYIGKYPDSFARGAIFQENAATGDRRNSGSFASLAGLEAALDAKDDAAAETAVQRMLMGVALICSFGGLPLLYMGDEIGLLNDYSFTKVTEHAHDNRWLHRPKMDWKAVARARKGEGPQGKLFSGVKHIVARRKAVPHIAADVPTRIINLGNPALFCFARPSDDGTMLGLFNFTEKWTSISADQLRGLGITRFRDLLGQGDVPSPNGAVAVAPYGRLWLV
ncbi:amylosucrase [Aestuariivirga sp.]|uniref:amylosucrase n=1 Tax=Aestuariivirga sp. TaxID=2650926 RepID=UPI0039E71BD8